MERLVQIVPLANNANLQFLPWPMSEGICWKAHFWSLAITYSLFLIGEPDIHWATLSSDGFRMPER